ncbi:MAG: DNA polymerase [Methanoregula sp. PtaU1.Bin051]|nr:MAG: DNA polymerase [Methanoregula sp. PtaU1.Bin051]
MWILDSWCGRGGVGFCDLDQGARIHREEYAPPFYIAFPDADRHGDLVEGLSGRFRVDECTFTTIFGKVAGYAVFAGQNAAGVIARQSGQDVELYNVDLRCDQRWMAERRISPCTPSDVSRFTPDFERDLRLVRIAVHGSLMRPHEFSCIAVTDGGRCERIRGPEKTVLADLGSMIAGLDPDVILFPDADVRAPALVARAQELDIDLPLSRTGHYTRLSATSYWSYGKVHYRGCALLPQGRVLIDTVQSFVYQEGGLSGVLLASRLTGMPPNFVSRHTPGTLVSAYEAYEAVSRGIAVPFHKKGPEENRSFAFLREMDRGGMMFQPVSGVYGDIAEIDFTSLYPSIIVRENLSPETIRSTEKAGFLAQALGPLLDLRVLTKEMKKHNSRYDGADAILKWLLVVSFGYTGFRNARFGSIEVHEKITAHARRILIEAKERAEDSGFEVLHGIVDSLWIHGGGDIGRLQRSLYQATSIPVEVDRFSWIAFLPQNDGTGAFTRYFGRRENGNLKVRGIAVRRHDTPPHIRKMQERILALMQTAVAPEDLHGLGGRAADLYHAAVRDLPSAPPSELVIRKRVSTTAYRHACLEGSAVATYRRNGIDIAPGMTLAYVVRDARRHVVDPAGECAGGADLHYYRELAKRAWEEVSFVFGEYCGTCVGRRDLRAVPVS